MTDRAVKYAKVITALTANHYFGKDYDRWTMTADTPKGSIYIEDAILIQDILAIKIGEQNAGSGI